MSVIAERLLASESGAVERRYLVAAGMLGHLAAGAPKAALSLRQVSRPTEGREWSFLLSLLSAHASEATPN
jgi:hypothetical protein